MKRGFTLIEMLVVIGIVVILVAATMGAYNGVTKAAERSRCQELVANTATALGQLFQENGAWPRALRSNGGATDALLDERAALPLAVKKYMPLTISSDGARLTGFDRFGVVSPWATAYIKSHGSNASLSDRMPSGGTLQDHILHYALDLDGDGIIRSASIGGESVDVRANVIVWCAGKDGKMEPYSQGLKKDDVYSWSKGQTVDVQ